MKQMTFDLKKWREDKGWSQSHTARMLGIANSTYRQWELNENLPASELVNLCRIYGLSISHILGQRMESNIELAKAIESIERGLSHLRSALPYL